MTTTLQPRPIKAPETKNRGPAMLVGFTDQRGEGWHYRMADAKRTYRDAVPIDDVKSELFAWTPVEGPVYTLVETTYGGEKLLQDPSRKAIVQPETGAILGVFKAGYVPHDYSQWLVDNVGLLLDGGLAIGQAGILYGGARAYVQVEMPDNRQVAGMEYRPYLTAATSLDGSLSSTYQVGATLIVCDNMVSATLGDREALRVKIRHSRRSLDRILEVREALHLIEAVGDEFEAAVNRLVSVEVTPVEWSAFLDAHVPMEVKGKPKEGRSLTLAQSKREDLSALWLHDTRVTPWKDTAFGVLQAVNTWVQHNSTVRGLSRAERNVERAIMGRVDDLDSATVRTLETVLGRAVH